MTLTQHRALVQIHGWSGLLFAAGIYVICLTGSFAVFTDTLLHDWLHKGLYGLDLAAPERLDAAFEAAVASRDDEPFEEATLRLPGDRLDGVYAVHFQATKDETVAIDAVRLKHLNGTDGAHQGAAYFIRRLHTDFLMPDPIGRILGGLVGLSLLILVGTGLVVHRHVLRDLFKIRLRKKWPIVSLDAHKLLGSWSIPFLLIMAFTGVFISLSAPYTLPALGLARLGGDVPALRQAILGPAPFGDALGNDDKVPLLPINVGLAQAMDGRDTAKIDRFSTQAGQGMTIRLREPGRACNIIVHVPQAEPDAAKAQCQISTIDGLTGLFLNAAVPFHAAHIGGMVIDVLWFVFGLVGAGGVWLGVDIWAQRRPRQRALQRRIFNGLFGGGLCAILAIIHADLWLIFAGSALRFTFVSAVFLGTVLAAMLVPMQTARPHLFAAAVLAVGAPVSHALVSGLDLDRIANTHSLLTYGVFAAFGLAAIMLARLRV